MQVPKKRNTWTVKTADRRDTENAEEQTAFTVKKKVEPAFPRMDLHQHSAATKKKESNWKG